MFTRSSFAILTVSLAALLAPVAPVHGADQPNAAEAKLRETVRNTLLQLRTLQGEKDTLQAEKDAVDAELKQVKEALEKLKVENTEKLTEKEEELTKLKAEKEKLDTDNDYLRNTSEKWRKDYQAAAALAEKKETLRAQLNTDNVILQRRIEDQFRKNAEMYRLSTEILGRYEDFSLGTALTAREPFVGTMRVKLQNLAQDYADKLMLQRIKPEPAPAPAKKAPEPAPAAKKPAAPAAPTKPVAPTKPAPAETAKVQPV